ncbi:hypothetical protein [uncultured Gammaproteobacteria bacterium]|nr:hypothetical protein [uncultured Gammaproteobacteria bacterium]CAC9655322.1 hypothetical protein [uncultured Gammaproteobacteria bacterium]
MNLDTRKERSTLEITKAFMQISGKKISFKIVKFFKSFKQTLAIKLTGCLC